MKELKKIKYILYTTKEKDKDIKVFSSKVKDENPQMENPNIQTRPQSSKTILEKKNNNFFPPGTDSYITEITNESNEKKLITYNSYSMYEMIKELLPSCCKTKDFEYKESLIRESHIILDSKLDIFLYIRNMLLFDSINKIYLENKNIINFLSRPIIYLNKSEEKGEEIEEVEDEQSKKERIVEKEFYEYSYKMDSKDLINEMKNLCKKPNKSDNEKDIILFLKKKLKGV